MVARGVRGGQGAGRAGDAVGRLLGLPLVPRDGARVVRGPADRGAAERQPRVHQGGPGGTARRGRRLHDRDPGDDRPGRLADDRVHDTGRCAVLLRHLLPARGVPAPRARRRQGLARGQGRGRRTGQPDRHRAGGAGRAVAGRGRGSRTGGHLPRGGADPGAQLRRPARRVRPGTQVPAVDGVRVPAPAVRAARRPRCRAGAGDGRRHHGGDGQGRHVRPARRGIRPLQRGRGLGGAALREDALRQRPAGPGVRALVAAHRRPAGPPGGARHVHLDDPRTAHRRGRPGVRAGCRQRRRGGAVLHLDPR